MADQKRADCAPAAAAVSEVDALRAQLTEENGFFERQRAELIAMTERAEKAEQAQQDERFAREQVERWYQSATDEVCALRPGLAAAMKVVEAARHATAWQNAVGDRALRNALVVFDARKNSGGGQVRVEPCDQPGNAVTVSGPSIDGADDYLFRGGLLRDEPPAGGPLPGLVDAAIERVAAACERADENAQTPWPWPLTRLAQVLREEPRKGGG